MPQTFLICDFGSNEEAAQRARHSVEGWKQGFRLDRKLLLKFDREEPEESSDSAAASAAGSEEITQQQDGKDAKGKKRKKAAAETKTDPAEDAAKGHVVLIVRLDFSDHERLSYQRWLDRIPTETAFKDAQVKVIRHNDEDFAKAAEKFDTLP